MKLALSILVGTLVLGAICQSYIAVGISPPLGANGQSDLTQVDGAGQVEPPSDETSVKSIRQNAERFLWRESKLTESDKMLDEDWQFFGKKVDAEGRDQFRRTARMMARLRTDFAAYKQGADCYSVVLKQDQFDKKNPLAIASDLNNVGLCLGVAAVTSSDSGQKQQLFSDAMTNLKQAESSFRNLDRKDDVFNCLVNQYTLLEDMHRKNDANSVFAQIQQIDSAPNSKLRALMIEQR